MGRTIVLRFSDYEISTIDAHLKIIHSSQYVWWGWWKKWHESMPTEALKEISRSLPLRIGLINRIAKKYYGAKCEEVVFDPNDQKGVGIKSPEPIHTPSYYQISKHPVWFKFSLIDELSGNQFEQQFGGTPEGDATFFVVERIRSGSTILDDLSVPKLEFIDTEGDSVLHISDLHFGEFYGFPEEDSKAPILELSLESLIYNDISALPNCNIGVVVLSGDLITKGDANYFAHVKSFLESLLKKLKLQNEHVVIVPGNHDIWLEGTNKATRNFKLERPYRDFLESFWLRKMNEIEILSGFQTPNKWKMSFLGLNSARPRTIQTKEYGYIGKDRYSPWLKRITHNNEGRGLAELARNKILNFVVHHHHLLLPPYTCKPEDSRPMSLTLDAGELVKDFQNSCIHYVLHGHHHVPFLGSTSWVSDCQNTWQQYKNPLFVMGGGSSGATVTALSDELLYNTFSIYTPTDRGLKVLVREFNRSKDPITIIDTEIPYD